MTEAPARRESKATSAPFRCFDRWVSRVSPTFVLAALALASWGACVLDRNGEPPESAGGASASSSTGVTTTSSSQASSGASSSSSASSSAVASSSSSSTGGPTEDCTNGVDDDGDGLVDCEDPDCKAAYHGLPFFGFDYGELDAQSCPSGALTGTTCGDCSKCTPQAGGCVADVLVFKDMKCGMKIYEQSLTGCQAPNLMSGGPQNLRYEVQVATDPNQKPSCMAGASTPTPASFCPVPVGAKYTVKGKDVVCAPLAVDCVRVPAPMACPKAFQAKVVPVSASCACGCTPTGQQCNGSVDVSFWQFDNCSGITNNANKDGNCHDVGAPFLPAIDFGAGFGGTNPTCSDQAPPVDYTICCAK